MNINYTSNTFALTPAHVGLFIYIHYASVQLYIYDNSHYTHSINYADMKYESFNSPAKIFAFYINSIMT